MKTIHFIYGLLACAPLGLAGCSGTGGVAWGEDAGGGGGPMATGAAAASGETVRTGSISTRLISGTVAIIAEHEATERQRRVAAERGHAWSARTSTRHGRYIAVDTERDRRTSPQAQKSVMIFDTEAQQVVGKNVYDVQSPPPAGEIARFQTYSALYVGPGL